jgi:nucleoside-diphosphate-sugar epimerase
VESALIGFTGFVGSTLLSQAPFGSLYRSTNIQEIRGRRFDLLVCAGAPAAKWIANREPEADRANLARLAAELETCQAERAVLISTVDVYPDSVGADERTPIATDRLQAYGRNRYWIEERFFAHFGQGARVVRLPGLYGKGLRKNFIFDLLSNPESLTLTHCRSVFQFYNMARLWSDLCRVVEGKIALINLATEPVSASEVAEQCFKVEFVNVTPGGPVRYDMRSVHAHLFGVQGPYLESRSEVLAGIRAFAEAEHQDQ